MKYFTRIILLFISLLQWSCEMHYTSAIVNNSKKPITVKVKIDNEAIDKKRKEYIENGFLFDKENPKDYEISISPSESYDLAGSMHTKPDFYNIKEIEIYSGDTLILKCRKDQMQKLFTSESNSGNLELIVK
ncbi:hypothetical protein [Flavobacterium sp. GCM10027622]|uniref:hypothetical protein n=1 Tax=unclassified Flavobacterium TaxID=196869 RepID=UPI003614405A